MLQAPSTTEIWDLLNLTEEVRAITQQLLSGEMQAALISGPPGSGKSWLARSIGATFVEAGGKALRGVGDEGEANRRLYTLRCIRAETTGLVRPLAEIGFVAANILTKVVTGGLVDAHGAREAISVEAARRKRSVIFLDEDEQAIFVDIERDLDGSPALLIADNLHWWDNASLSLLKMILDKRVQQAFPFMNDLRVLAIITDANYQKPVWEGTVERSILPYFQRQIKTTYVPKAHVRSAVSALGITDTIEQSDLDTLYDISGGHLSILMNGCRYLTQQKDSLSTLSIIDREQFLDDLFMDRIRKIPEFSSDAKAFLDAASIVGAVAPVLEIDCLLKNQTTPVGRVIEICENLEFIESSNDVVEFRHDYIKRFFARRLGRKEGELRKTFAECLRQLTPSDYFRRAENQYRAGLKKEAAELFVIAIIDAIRNGYPINPLKTEEATISIHEAGYDSVLAEFGEAYKLFSMGQDSESKAIIEGLGDAYPKSILAEIEFLRSHIDLNSRNNTLRQTVIDRLDAWKNHLELEAEQGLRLLVLLRFALILQLDKKPARLLDQQITQFLSARMSFDPQAEQSIHKLGRSAEGLFLPDIALKRVERAEQFYRPDKSGLPKEPAEYFRCLNNLAALKLVNGNLDEALDTTDTALSLAKKFDGMVFPRKDLTQTIQTLVRFRRGDITALHAVELQEKVIAQSGHEYDPFYPANHLSVYRCLSGDLAKAISEFEALKDKLDSLGDPEPNPYYFVVSNLWSARYLAGDNKDNCLQAWQELQLIVDVIPYETRALLKIRHQILEDVIEQSMNLSPNEWDLYPLKLKNYPPHSAWREIGRGFRMPDPQFWSLF